MSRPDPELLTSTARAALTAQSTAYAPYSDFRAGAAVLTDDGDIVSGAIVENISLGLAMCAERVAMFSAATSRPGESPRLRALALAAPTTGPRRTWPCGACRQVALELGGGDVLVASVGSLPADAVDDIEWRPLDELLPDAPYRNR